MESTGEALGWALWLTYCIASGWYCGGMIARKTWPIYSILVVAVFNGIVGSFLPL